MSLRSKVSPAIPKKTVRVARASFPKGSRYTRVRDELCWKLGDVVIKRRSVLACR